MTDIPGFSGLDKKTKTYVIGGVVLLAGIVYYRHKKSASSAASTSAATDPNSIDPATGYPYNSQEDLAALAAQQAAGSGGGSGGVVDTNGTVNPNQTTSFVDNAAWEQAAVAYLTGIGLDGPTVSDALGKYLAGQPVAASGSDMSIINQAIAAENQPPVAGANGYPPHIRVAEAPSNPPSHGPTPAQHKTVLPTPSLRIVSERKGLARLAWTPDPHATYFDVHYSPTGRRAESRIIAQVRGSSFDVRSHGYYTVWAVPSASAPYVHSNGSNAVHVTRT